MASKILIHGADLILQQAASYLATAGRIKTLLVRAGSSALTENVENVADFTDLRECDDASYARQTLTGVVPTKVAAKDRTELDATPPEFTMAGDSSTDVVAMVHYIDVGANDATNVVLSVQDIPAHTPPAGTYEPGLPTSGLGYFKANV